MDCNALAEEYARHRRVHPEVVKGLLESGKIQRNSQVLEVGCGTGNYIISISEATGCKAWGIDPSKAMLAKAAGRSRDVEFMRGYAERLDFPESTFDLVFSVDVIHHVSGKGVFFHEANRVLKPGGKLCTVTDSEWIIRNRKPLSVYFPETVELELARYPKIPELRIMMEQGGFKQIYEANVEFAYPLLDIDRFREKAYSSLHLISEEVFRRGLQRMEEDLKARPIVCVSYYLMLWGEKV